MLNGFGGLLIKVLVLSVWFLHSIYPWSSGNGEQELGFRGKVLLQKNRRRLGGDCACGNLRGYFWTRECIFNTKHFICWV